MKTNKSTRIPSLRKCNNRGFVELNGQRIYLGPWGDPATEEAHERTIAEWLANRRTVPVDRQQITITELCRDYWIYCEDYYRKPDGTNTSSLDRTKQSLKPLQDLYGSIPAKECGPNALRTIREEMLLKGLSRRTINDYVAVVKQMFKWAASHEKIDIQVYQAIATVDNLKAGRSEAKESEPVQPVPESHINAVEPFVSRQVWALIQLQLLTGTRAGELLKLRPCDLDVSGKVWTATLTEHKTSYRGGKRTIYFGPKAQSILHEFIASASIQGYLFNPREAENERRANAPTHRRPDQKNAPNQSGRKVGEYYTTASYRRAIQRACEKAGVPSWTPHRLRHNAATHIRKEYGLDCAQIILGHSNAAITEIYAEIDATKAIRVIEEIG